MPVITVLYVDDEPVMLDTFRLFLEKDPDYRVLTALSAKAALALLEETPCDAIVSDYEMPKMDGIEFLKVVREKYPRIPFIIFTGKGREEIVIESLNYGADYYVRKGGDPRAQFAELSSKIKHAVALRESEKKVARMSRLYIVLSRVSEAIVRIHDRRALMEEVCTIAVQEGGFARAWFGFENADTLAVTAVVAENRPDGSFADVRESSEPLPEGNGLALTAARQGQPSISNDILADPAMAVWHPVARSCGCRAAASFPVSACRHGRGAITFYSAHQGFFTDSEIGLLSELAEDISYALDMMEMEANRRSIKNELEQSRRQLAGIVNFLPEPTFAVDKTGTVIIWNQAMEQLSGVTADEVIGKDNYEHTWRVLGTRRPALLDLLEEPDEVLARHGYTEVTRHRQTVSAEAAVENIRGAPAILRMTATPLLDENGVRAGAIESVQDITRLRAAEDEIAQGREKYRLLSENVSDAVVVHGLEGSIAGHFTEANGQACRLLGYPRDDLMRLSLSDVAEPAMKDLLPSLMEELRNRSQIEFRIVLVTRDGRRVQAAINARAFVFQGKPAVLSIIRDAGRNGSPS